MQQLLPSPHSAWHALAHVPSAGTYSCSPPPENVGCQRAQIPHQVLRRGVQTAEPGRRARVGAHHASEPQVGHAGAQAVRQQHVPALNWTVRMGSRVRQRARGEAQAGQLMRCSGAARAAWRRCTPTALAAHIGLRSLCRTPSCVCRWSRASATSSATWRPLQARGIQRVVGPYVGTHER